LGPDLAAGMRTSVENRCLQQESQMRRAAQTGDAGRACKMLSTVLAELLRDPKRVLVDSWNWKAATLSVLLRAPVYMIATMRHGLQVVAAAGTVEGLFSAAFAGVYASITQAIEDAGPQWAVALLLLIALPAVALLIDACVHHLARTPNLKTGVIASLVISILSSGFNWYSMRRGTLLVGPRAQSFGSDLIKLPVLIGSFLLAPLLIIWRGARSCPDERWGTTVKETKCR